MIVVDTSALIALLFKEDDLERYLVAIVTDDRPVIAAPSLFETSMVAGRQHGPEGMAAAERLVRSFDVTTVPWTMDHVAEAHQAFARYGKGSGHPAQLNFGDCMSYALAKALDAPLLFKGEDFALTDVRPAL